MADEAFRHKFSAQKNEWEISFRAFSLLCPSLCLFFYSFLFSSSLSSFQSRLLSPRAFLAFFFLLLSRRHLPTSGNLQGTNIWEMQFEHLSATKERQTMLEKTRGINTPPTWCWTNMSRCLQFTDGPATASGAHRCGNSRTNLIAPVVPFFSGLFLGLFARRVCPTVVWQIRSFRDASFKKWRHGCSEDCRTCSSSSDITEEKIGWRRSRLDGAVQCFTNSLWSQKIWEPIISQAYSKFLFITQEDNTIWYKKIRYTTWYNTIPCNVLRYDTQLHNTIGYIRIQ